MQQKLALSLLYAFLSVSLEPRSENALGESLRESLVVELLGS